jgi:hypothetical protein
VPRGENEDLTLERIRKAHSTCLWETVDGKKAEAKAKAKAEAEDKAEGGGDEDEGVSVTVPLWAKMWHQWDKIVLVFQLLTKLSYTLLCGWSSLAQPIDQSRDSCLQGVLANSQIML